MLFLAPAPSGNRLQQLLPGTAACAPAPASSSTHIQKPPLALLPSC